jgi:hypothetical protein
LWEVQYEGTVDETSIRKGQRYLTVVVDHDSGSLVWAAPGRERETLEEFLDLLGNDAVASQADLLRHGSWITGPGPMTHPRFMQEIPMTTA